MQIMRRHEQMLNVNSPFCHSPVMGIMEDPKVLHVPSGKIKAGIYNPSLAIDPFGNLGKPMKPFQDVIVKCIK